MPVQTQILTRRGTAASWTSTNPTLGAGEIGYETDTGNFKIGTGAAAWASLAYFNRDPLTTKGDLYTFSTTDARLAVGNNGETLVADSSQTTGLRYTAGTVQANPVLNSAFQVWQRGTSIAVSASSAPYVADRWQVSTQANQASTVSRQSTSDTTNLPFIQYCARVQRNSGQTGTGTIQLGQSFETINSIPFAGKAITFSFYARAGANYSASSSLLGIDFISGTGTDQNRVTAGYTGNSNVFSQSATLTTTWQRFTFTGTVPSTSTELAALFLFAPTGTASTNDYYELTGVQLDIGSVALPFRTYAGTLQGELAACQRYYFRTTATTQYDRFTTYSPAGSTTNLYAANFVVPVQMRVKPTTIDFSNLTWYDGLSVGTAVSAVTISSNATPTNAALDVVTTGMTQYRPVALMSNTTSGFLGIGAEL